MDNNWASQNLQVIRTLMERSALYRRALAPVMLWAGNVGIVAAIAGNMAHVETAQEFAIYWLVVSVVVSVGAFLLMRRQAIKDGEPFWSPPTRRVAQAVMPAFFLGAVLSLLFLGSTAEDSTAHITLPPMWMALYGCALHSAGFFMQRGIRLFGWLFVIAATTLFFVILRMEDEIPFSAHTIMGLSFGAFHFAYGGYLYFTEKRKNAA